MINNKIKDYVEFLRDLADRMMDIPVNCGIDQADIDDLLLLVRDLEKMLK